MLWDASGCSALVDRLPAGVWFKLIGRQVQVASNLIGSWVQVNDGLGLSTVFNYR